MGFGTGGIQDWRDTEKENSGMEGFRAGGILAKRIQDMIDAEQERCWI